VDDSGLSVTFASTGSEAGIREEARSFADGFRKTYGVALLNVGNVREEDSKLDVIADPLIDSPNHALITGIPRPDHDTREAERLAGKLARISRRIL
jgi:hypothetical protein